MKSIVFIVCAAWIMGSAQGVLAAEVVQAADGMGLGCESAEDYKRSKISAYRVESSTISLRQQKEIIIRAKIEAAQRSKLDKNRYEWRLVNPLHKVHFEHEHYDFETGQFTIKNITIEPKDVQMLAVDDGFKLLGEGRVAGSMSKGFYSSMSIPIAALISNEQHRFIESGKVQQFRVGIFLKSKFRHVVAGSKTEGEPAAYEESGGSAMFYVKFSIRKANGQYRLL
jgi:hypothetical protein